MENYQPTANLEDYADLKVDKKQAYLLKFVAFDKQFYTDDTGIVTTQVE